MKKHILKLSLIALLGFGLFACGNDDTSSASSTPASSNTTSSVATNTTTSTTTSSATSSATSSTTSSAAEVQLSKLADIKTIAKGTKVKFRGSYQGMNNKVYTFNGVQQYTSYFLADGNEWTQLFKFDKNLVPEGINIGDIVEVEGTTAHYTNKANTYTIHEVTPTSIKKVTDETIVAGNWMTINETSHEALTLDMLNKGAHIENAVVLEKTIDAKYGNVSIDFKFGETNYTLLLDSRYTDVEAAEISNLAQNDIFSCDTYVGVNSSTSKAQFVYANNFTRTQGATVDVTGVTADAEISVAAGSSKKITASVTPSNATNKELTYTSNNTEIATVDTNGTVKGIKEGTTTITVASVADTTKTATVNVTVTKAPDTGNYTLIATHDFTTGTDNGTVLTTATAKTTFEKNVTSGTSEIESITEIANVFDGNGAGGAKENQAGLIKFSTSKKNGSIEIKFNTGVLVSKVVINCHAFYKNDKNGTNTSMYLAVNDLDKIAAPYNADATPEDIEFVIENGSNTVKINATGRVVMYSISFYSLKAKKD